MNNRPNEISAAKSHLIAGAERAVPDTSESRVIRIEFPISYRSGLSTHDVITVLASLPLDAMIMSIVEEDFKQSTVFYIQSREFDKLERGKFVPSREIVWEFVEINNGDRIRRAVGLENR